MEDAKVTFYSIKQCGLYEYGSAERILGSLPLLLNQLKVWVKQGNKGLDETCTYEPEEDEGTFCYDLVSNDVTGDFLLTTWNKTPLYEGAVAAVDAKSIVGSAKVEFTELPEGRIPGYATYFWFVPESDVFATIQFQHRMNGKQNFDHYIRGFISKFSDYSVFTVDGAGDLNLAGYSENGVDNPLNLYPSFNAKVVRKPGDFEEILNQRNSITKVIRHNTLLPGVEDAQDWWEKSLSFLKLLEKPELKTEVDISYEFAFNPSEGELINIIDSWKENHGEKWDDVGFKITGRKSPLWLSNSLAREDFPLDVKRVDQEIVDATSILEQLTDKRDSILALLK